MLYAFLQVDIKIRIKSGASYHSIHRKANRGLLSNTTRTSNKLESMQEVCYKARYSFLN